jgi:hypothetical protein
MGRKPDTTAMKAPQDYKTMQTNTDILLIKENTLDS